jgi:hypothetical protein
MTLPSSGGISLTRSKAMALLPLMLPKLNILLTSVETVRYLLKSEAGVDKSLRFASGKGLKECRVRQRDPRNESS